MSTFYASFESPSGARRLINELLSEGIASDDVSLLSPQNGTQTEGEPTTTSVGDATVLVGRSDDPVNDDLVPTAIPTMEYDYQTAAPYGAGISTAHPDASADTVDQSDDSQSNAERDMLPDNDRPRSRHEVFDLQQTLNTGFPTPVPLIDGFNESALPPDGDSPDALDSIAIPGFAVVAGGGSLATAALDGMNGSGADRSLLAHLRDQGVPQAAAEELVRKFDSGGAVVAIQVVPGEFDPDRIEEIAGRLGAEVAGTYDAPRY